MNRVTRAWPSALALALTLGTSSFALAQTAGEPKRDTPPQKVDKPADETNRPDNTNTNKRDRSSKEPTADQQKNNKSDVQIAAQIRRAVVADKSLSTYAHNVKIIAKGGVVTLKGPVRSDAEKAAIEQMAVAVVGQANVTNQIEVKP